MCISGIMVRDIEFVLQLCLIIIHFNVITSLGTYVSSLKFMYAKKRKG